MLGGSKDKPFKGQDYRKLRRECLRKKKLFLDNEFPPAGSSLFFNCHAPADIVWKRPKDIVTDPKFFIDKASADDFSQGSLGNCWFVAACACIAEDSDLWKKVVPGYREQVFTPDSRYAGIFHFKFWRCGSWVDVVIDDYLPTRGGHLIFTHSKSRNEFWSALLEKAYAKLCGCYEALTSGKARDAMVDMTGGVAEGLKVADFETEQTKDRLFEILYKAKSNLSLMCASIEARSAAEMETKLTVGLVRGHAYSITDIKRIPLRGTGLFSFFNNREKIHMVRLRNPWGGVEWKGPWSDKSQEWTKVSLSEKKDLGLTYDENGEFWMAYEDFCRYFTDIDICHMMNTSFFALKRTWKEKVETGEWRRANKKAGGCGNHQSFLQNPQYLLELSEDEKELMVSLEQEDRRSSSVRKKGENYIIGFSIIKTDLNRKYRMHNKMERLHAGPFVNARSILTRLELKKGRYCLIPSTFNPGLEGQYLLRMYSDKGLTLKPMIKDVPSPPRFYQKPKIAATSVTVHYIEGFEIPDGESGNLVHRLMACACSGTQANSTDPGIEAYCILKCEGQKVKTPTTAKSSKPEWKDRVTFYRQKPTEDVVIEVWGKHMLKDYLMGTLTLPMSKASEYKGGDYITRYQLVMGTGKGQEEHKRGFIWANVKHTENLMEI